MIPIIIAYDEEDSKLGSFIKACKIDIDSFFATKNESYLSLDSINLNIPSINRNTTSLNEFIFGAYSHGDSSSLLRSGSSQYISKIANGDKFHNSFFYTFSCSAGNQLGLDLIDSGCLCFIGYSKVIYIWTNFMDEFIECANEGLFKFIDGYNTEEVISFMIKKYDDKIDSLYNVDFLAASDLRNNRDALVMHGKVISMSKFQ